jgi:hypothetical protein
MHSCLGLPHDLGRPAATAACAFHRLPLRHTAWTVLVRPLSSLSTAHKWLSFRGRFVASAARAMRRVLSDVGPRQLRMAAAVVEHTVSRRERPLGHFHCGGPKVVRQRASQNCLSYALSS